MHTFGMNDRVKLTEDFNNEPGILPKGTTGTVVGITQTTMDRTQDLVFVVFDNMPEDFMKKAAFQPGMTMPMFPSEIEKVGETLYEITATSKDGDTRLVRRGINADGTNALWRQLCRENYSINIRKITE